MSLFSSKAANKKNKKDKRKKPHSAPGQESVRGAEKQAIAGVSLDYLLCLHRSMAVEAVKRLWATPVASFMSSLMIALAFVLPALFYLLVVNIQELGEGWDGSPKLSLYLTVGISEKSVVELKKEVANITGIDYVTYISADDGLAVLEERAGIKEVVSELGYNPLPSVLQLGFAESLTVDELDSLIEHVAKLPDVEKVRLDKKWIQRLLVISNLLEQAAIVLAILLGLTVWLAINNTIGLSIAARKDEIQVVKLVGGTNGFIMLPFLYMGIIYGVTGACLAMFVVGVVLVAIMPFILDLAGLYANISNVILPVGAMFFALILSGFLLGISGAVVSCYRCLKGFESC